MSAIRGLAFDLDGVIADSATLHFAAWKRLADELGIPFTAEDNEALKGVDRINSLRHILRLGQRALPENEIERLAARKNGFYVDAISTLTADALLPGAAALLDEAAARGLRIGLASASRNAPALLERLGVADAFEFIADPADHRPKPAPDLFLACARAFDLPPQAMIGFEDAPAGIEAIRAAGFRAVGIGETSLPRADVQFATLADIDLATLLG